MRAPMPAVQVWIDGDRIHLHDANGFAALPIDDIQSLHATANRSDRCVAWVNGRAYGRDLLASALSLLMSRFGACGNCHEAPATRDMGDDTHYCPACASAAQGTRFDDRQDFS